VRFAINKKNHEKSDFFFKTTLCSVQFCACAPYAPGMLAYMRIICIQYREWFIFEGSSSSQLHGLPGARFFLTSPGFFCREIFSAIMQSRSCCMTRRGVNQNMQHIKFAGRTHTLRPKHPHIHTPTHPHTHTPLSLHTHTRTHTGHWTYIPDAELESGLHASHMGGFVCIET